MSQWSRHTLQDASSPLRTPFLTFTGWRRGVYTMTGPIPEEEEGGENEEERQGREEHPQSKTPTQPARQEGQTQRRVNAQPPQVRGGEI